MHYNIKMNKQKKYLFLRRFLMKNAIETKQCQNRHFTLIELLVVTPVTDAK